MTWKTESSVTEPILSIIIPAFNEEKRIGKTLQSIHDYFSAKPISYELIVVNDGSRDNTTTVVEQYNQIMPELSIVHHKNNKGKGAAVRTGMNVARAKYHLFMDADNSVDIRHIDSFMKAINAGRHDIAIGSIKKENSQIDRSSLYRKILRISSGALVKILINPGVLDTQRGFKLFTREASSYIFSHQTINGFGFDIEILVIARKKGYSIVELPVRWDNPNKSTVTFFSYFKALFELVKIAYWRSNGKYDA